MRKVVIHRPGGHDRLVVERHPDPPVGPGEVRIAVRAIGVNYADVMVRMGLYASAKRYVGWPITPGFEVAGTVDAAGEGVDLPVGAEVLAVTRFGGYAERLVVPRWQVRPVPSALSFETAAAVPVAFLTAWYAVHELAHPHPRQRALVHSAAGGVGGALVQVLVRAGCDVIGVVGGSHKIAAAKAAGASAVVDRSAGDPWPALERLAPFGFHHVFDANGADSIRRSFDHLAAPGKLVIYGFHGMLPRGAERPSWARLAWTWLRTPSFSPLTLTGTNRSVLGFNLSYLFEERAMFEPAIDDVLGGLASGALRPPEVRTFPLEDVAKAHAALESGATTGKLVLLT